VSFDHGDMRISNIMEHVVDQSKFDQISAWTTRQLEEAGYESVQSAALAEGGLTFRIIDFGHSSISDKHSAAVLVAGNQQSQHHKRHTLALKRLPGPKGLVETVYRWLYGGKSDTWRLLRSLAPRLDGRWVSDVVMWQTRCYPLNVTCRRRGVLMCV
jgi:hypothetical protein